jgi:hypothetical protein
LGKVILAFREVSINERVQVKRRFFTWACSTIFMRGMVETALRSPPDFTKPLDDDSFLNAGVQGDSSGYATGTKPNRQSLTDDGTFSPGTYGQYPPRNPLLPAAGGMAAADGNQPFAFSNNDTDGGNDSAVNTGKLDDLTIPKDTQYTAGADDDAAAMQKGMEDFTQLHPFRLGATEPQPDAMTQQPLQLQAGDAQRDQSKRTGAGGLMAVGLPSVKMPEGTYYYPQDTGNAAVNSTDAGNDGSGGGVNLILHSDNPSLGSSNGSDPAAGNGTLNLKDGLVIGANDANERGDGDGTSIPDSLNFLKSSPGMITTGGNSVPSYGTPPQAGKSGNMEGPDEHAIEDNVLKNASNPFFIPGVGHNLTDPSGMADPAFDGKRVSTTGQGVAIDMLSDAQKDLALAAQRGERSYEYDDNVGVSLVDGQYLKGLRQAKDDGLASPQWVTQIYPQAAAAQEAWDAREKLVDEAGGWARVKALLYGAGAGGAFLASAPVGGAVGAEVGGPYAWITAPAGAAITGTIGALTYKELLSKLGEYSDVIDSFNASAQLHPSIEFMGGWG